MFWHHRNQKSMASIPVTPASVLTPAPSKFVSFMTKFGDILRDIGNIAVNIGEQEAPVIEEVLPPAFAASYAKILSAAAAQVAAADARYAAIGASNVPFGVKIAEAVAIGGGGVIAIAAQAGLVVGEGQIVPLFNAAAQFASSLNLANVTETPKPPAA